MTPRLLAAAGLAVCLTWSLSAATFEPAGDVPGAVENYKGALAKAAAEKAPMDAAKREAALNAAVAGLDAGRMSLADLSALSDARMLVGSSKTAAFAARLEALAAAPDAEGARAALLRLSMTPSERGNADAQTAAAKLVLNHPSLGAALDGGKAVRMLGMLGGLGEDSKKAIMQDVLALADKLPATMTPEAASFLPSLLAPLASSKLTAAERDPLRMKLLALVEGARAQVSAADDPVGERLDGAAKYFRGTLAKHGDLVGHPAPELEILWSSGEQPIASLADLRGKVVVIDFWATWCGPCIASFPKVKEMAARYKDYPVVILGVTSLQGYHISEKREKIDTTGNPAEEFRLMGEYLKAQDLPWPTVFSKEAVFNPEYGVTGIPHVVIIDPKGIVRHRGLHPARPLKEKAAKIDELLKEAGLPVPAPVDTPAAG